MQTMKYVVVANASAPAVGEWIQLTAPDGSYVRGKVISLSTGTTTTTVRVGEIKPATLAAALAVNVYLKEGTSATNAASAGWVATYPRTRGITLCNTTDGSTTGIQAESETNTNLPRMSVARGNYSLWNAQERWQCVWGTQSNNNDPSDSGLMAYPDAPSQSSQGLDPAGKGSTTGKGDYFVRIAGLQVRHCSEPNAASSTRAATTSRSACCRVSARPTGSASA